MILPPRFEVGIAGVTFENRQEHLAELYQLQQAHRQLGALLIRDPLNAFDPNAIAVSAHALPNALFPDEAPFRHIGFLPRIIAASLAILLDAPPNDGCKAAESIRIYHLPETEGHPAVYGAVVTVSFNNGEVSDHGRTEGRAVDPE